MKVLLVTRGYPQKHNNNLGLFERDQAIALKNIGHDVAYAVVDIRSIRKKRKFGFNYYIDENGIKVFEMNWPIGPMPRKLIEYFRQEALMHLYKHIEKIFGKPDIVHAHFLNYGVISLKLCRKANLPLVVTEHSSYLMKEKKSNSIIQRANKTYKGCNAIISVSQPLANEIKKISGYDSIIINNIATVKMDNQKTDNNHSKKFVFASAANLLKGKGFDILINSFYDLIKKNKNVELWIYGDGPEKNNLIKLTKKLGLEEYIHFYGRYEKKDIYKLFSRANCFVLASRSETFGVVYIEAMTCGLPVIATKCGGPETFVNDDNGYLVPVDDIKALSNAMNSIIKNINHFNSEKIKKFANDNFSEEAVAKKITEVYEKVLNQE